MGVTCGIIKNKAKFTAMTLKQTIDKNGNRLHFLKVEKSYRRISREEFEARLDAISEAVIVQAGFDTVFIKF
jgi:hypothetical protein